jgi:cobalamin biosynthesis protein CobD/CbiB
METSTHTGVRGMTAWKDRHFKTNIMNNGITAVFWMIAVPTILFSIAAIIREFPIASLVFFSSLFAGASLYNLWKRIKEILDENDKNLSS